MRFARRPFDPGLDDTGSTIERWELFDVDPMIDPMIELAGLREMGAHYASANLRHPLAAPLYASFRGLPPLLIQVGTRELLLDDSTRSASVRTVEKSSFCIIYKEDFNRVLDQYPNIGRQLVRNLAQRVRKLTADVKSLALQDVYGRVASVLMDLSEERSDGTLYIPEKLTQQDIADRVGASREMVARILKDLTIGEYIRFEGRHIIINSRLPAKY